MRWISNKIIVFYKLLLLSYHVFKVNYCSGLKLQVQQQLHVLALKEVVFYHKLEVVFYIFIFYTSFDTVSNVSDLLIILVQILLHRMPLYQILFGRFVQNKYLLLLLLYAYLQTFLLFL